MRPILLTICFLCLLSLIPPAAQAASYRLPENGDNVVGAVTRMKLDYEDTLASVAERFSLGYREIVAHLNGEMALAEAVTKIKHASHRYARQQYNWFRLKDPRINWFNSRTPPAEMLPLVREFIGRE